MMNDLLESGAERLIPIVFSHVASSATTSAHGPSFAAPATGNSYHYQTEQVLHTSRLPSSSSSLDNISSGIFDSFYCLDQCHFFFDRQDCANSGILSWFAFWCKNIVRRVFLRYLNSTITLLVVPLAVGLVLGWILRGWNLDLHYKKECSTTLRQHRLIAGVGGEDGTSSKRGRVDNTINLMRFIFGYMRTMNGIAVAQRLKIATHVKSFITWLSSVREFIRQSISFAFNNGVAKVSDWMADRHHYYFTSQELHTKEAAARRERDQKDSKFESNVPLHAIPKHIAVIMDGNRRYGRARYGSAAKGHWDGSRRLCDFARWCQEEGIQVLTVYAFSTENWSRSEAEISRLMTIILKYCDEIREDALRRGMKVRIISTDTAPIPHDVTDALKTLQNDTSDCSRFLLNICLSYGSRSEIVNACRSIVTDVQAGELLVHEIDERQFGSRLQIGNIRCDTKTLPDPDVLIRTSGEYRISNFLLWQLAYTELFFVKKQWPELEKKDLISIVRKFATSRQRRYGK